MLFAKQPVNHLTNNSVERLKVGSIKRSLDNRRYESNAQMTISINYLLMVIKGYLLDDNYIV